MEVYATHEEQPGIGLTIREMVDKGMMEYEVKGQWFPNQKAAQEYAKTASKMFDGLFTVMFQGVEPVAEFKQGKLYTKNVG